MSNLKEFDLCAPSYAFNEESCVHSPVVEQSHLHDGETEGKEGAESTFPLFLQLSDSTYSTVTPRFGN